MKIGKALGLPVSGQKGTYTQGYLPPQKSIEELEPCIRAMLSDEDVHSFGWRQSTPYFNDGDPCIFRISQLWVRPAGVADEMWDTTSYHYDHAVRHYSWDGTPKSPQHHIDLDLALQSGAYNMALLELFGDPTEVTVSRSGITLEVFDHD